MTDTLIKADNVSKKFCRSLKRSLWYGLNDMGSELLGRDPAGKTTLRKNEFWAVKNINFEVKRGDCIGLIGHNGAGKSTLLKMMNGLIKPDTGHIEMRGRVGALIELGAGFNPILTGRENVYVNGSVLGFPKKEIDRMFDAIVHYAELEDFIDTPVQYYSSGMKVRLGFSVASQMKPDILLIDEVLAVGDLGFKLKCFNTMDQMMENTALIFVSHSMPMISRMCTDIILMDKGKPQYTGTDVAHGIDLYYNTFGYQDAVVFQRDNSIHHISTEVVAEHHLKTIPVVRWMDDLVIRTTLDIKTEYRHLSISLIIFDKEQKPLGVMSNWKTENEFSLGSQTGTITLETRMRKMQLSKGLYSLDLVVSEDYSGKPILRIKGVTRFHVADDKDIWPPMRFVSEWITLDQPGL